MEIRPFRRRGSGGGPRLIDDSRRTQGRVAPEINVDQDDNPALLAKGIDQLLRVGDDLVGGVRCQRLREDPRLQVTQDKRR